MWLLSKLKLAAAGIDRSVSPYQALVNSLTFFHTLRQQRDESIENYRRRFESAWNSAVMNKASVGRHLLFTKFAIEHDDTVSDDQEVEDKLAATYFITFADSNRFHGLWADLSNSTLLGRDDYPQNLTAAYDLLSHYKGAKKQESNDGPINVSFAQVRQVRNDLPPLAGSNGETLANISCWKCMRAGHLSRHCPDRLRVQNVQLRYTQLTHTPSDIVPSHWLLLDSGSTVSSICNTNPFGFLQMVVRRSIYSMESSSFLISQFILTRHQWRISFPCLKWPVITVLLWIPAHLLVLLFI